MTVTTDIEVLRSADELSADWLARALGTGPIAGFRADVIGTGQMSRNHRVAIDYADSARSGPRTVVLKTASPDEGSRSSGVGLGVYEREVRFYQELAPRIGGPVPACHVAVIDPAEGWFTLVLEDAAPAVQGDQIAGCSLDEARLAVHELAKLHAPVVGDSQLGVTPWLNQPNPLNQAVVTALLGAFLDRYGDQVSAEHTEVCRRFVASLDGWSSERRAPLGLVHGDYRLDNLLFGAAEAPRRFLAVDWQTVSWGPVMTDVSYFLGGSLRVEDRRAFEEMLVREYFEQLHAHGVRGLSWEACWEGYRRQAFLGLVMTIAPAVLVERTERGDAMFMTLVARYAQQVLDLGALDLLPEPGTGRPEPLRPEPADEHRHPAGGEQLWNESWYFDAIADDGRTGAYVRFGLYPNMDAAWVTAFVCGPGRPTVAVVDFAAPLPDAPGLVVERDGLRLELVPEADLERYRVRLAAGGVANADAAALLRDGATGAPVDVELDLVWETLGAPFAYRLATRYEIPCRVAGTLRVGDEDLAFSGLGQRDHSWGARDWWSAEWMWSAGHLDDGTRFHGVHFRIPGSPALGTGYLQPPDGGVVELDTLDAREDVGADGLIRSAQVTYGDLVLDVEPEAFGPLRLVAPDGRLSEFPRAMCRVTAADGRRGVGWFEWNRNASLGGR